MGYKDIVQKIKNLNWEGLDSSELQQLMYLSYISATEFAEAFRIAIRLYPYDQNLKQTEEGELNTENLSFEDYSKKGDHAEFLVYFISKYNLESHEVVKESGKVYLEKCRAFPDVVRAMTIFSRERELPNIFQRILEAKGWGMPSLDAFKYYLSRHIGLDSDKGGHSDLTKEFEVDDSVVPFWEARLEMYRAIPKLLNNL